MQTLHCRVLRLYNSSIYSKRQCKLYFGVYCAGSAPPPAAYFRCRSVHILAELLKNKDNAPVAILASLSYQLRRIYGVKLALQRGKRQKDIRDLLKIRWDFIADRLILSAGRFSMAQLRGAVAECVEAEYKMKSSSGDDAELLKEIFIHLILGDAA